MQTLKKAVLASNQEVRVRLRRGAERTGRSPVSGPTPKREAVTPCDGWGVGKTQTGVFVASRRAGELFVVSSTLVFPFYIHTL